MANKEEGIRFIGAEELERMVESGEIDREALYNTGKGMQLMKLFMAYCEMQEYSPGIIVTSVSNVPIYIAGEFLENGMTEEAFNIIDGAIDILQDGKKHMMEKFNARTDEFCKPPTE